MSMDCVRRTQSLLIPLFLCTFGILLAACNDAAHKENAELEEPDYAALTDDKSGKDSGTVTIRESYLTTRDTVDNVDSPAIWHGPDGQHWLLATAKATDRILIYNAADGSLLQRFGGSGTQPGQLERPNGIAVIGNTLLVVERDNHRVQLFSLPKLQSLGFIGAKELIRPYGLWVQALGGDEHALYVTDNYETADEQIPPDSALTKRVHFWRFRVAKGKSTATYFGAFGAGSGAGVLRKVETIWGDPVHKRLLIADEHESRVDIKVYTLEGRFTGTILGADVFKSEPEGIVLYECADGGGFWICTDQSHTANVFHVFDRASLQHLGAFAGQGTRNTDGIALTQRAFGSFAKGAFFAVHDDGNISAMALEHIAAPLGLRLDCTLDGGSAGL